MRWSCPIRTSISTYSPYHELMKARTRESSGRVVLYSMIRDAESGEPGCPKASEPRVKMYAAFIGSERERIRRKRINEGELDPKWGDG